MRKSASNSSFYDRGADLPGRHAVDGQALAPARLAADEADRRPSNTADTREQLDERIVRGALHRRRCQSNEECIVACAGNFCLAGSGDDADVQLDTGWRGTN